MAILELRILPPLAIGRLGASKTPLDSFDLEVDPQRPLDYRRIVPKRSFRVDPHSGELSSHLPDSIAFKDGREIRPVAPFLEVFAITSDLPDELVPLTVKLLKVEGLTLDAVRWDVEVANIKIYRRTGDPADRIVASAKGIADHAAHALSGRCDHFLTNKVLPLGSVRFIKPTNEFPEIRLRFTPATGKVYGSSLTRATLNAKNQVVQEPDPVITSEDLILYDGKRGHWPGYFDKGAPTDTNPGSIYAGFTDADNNQVSWGYLDDECDGIAAITLSFPDGKTLSAHAFIGAGPPAFAPDTLPVRVISDELEQILLGPDVDEVVPIDEAEDIVRRALETVRLLNTAVMNGNAIDGRLNIASTMVRQDTNDFGRYFEPIMAPSLVDNLAVRALHERVFNGLATGAAPWFAEVLRRPDEIGDLSNSARRKMPALMRNADGRALVLTRRQINTIIRAAASAAFSASPTEDRGANGPPGKSGLTPGNLTAQLHHRGEGNPFSVLPRSAISNCFPGLEFDFRNLWRRAFEGIVLLESNNYVVEAEDQQFANLVGKRLLSIDGLPTGVKTTGPIFPQTTDTQDLFSSGNPNGVSFMEWSNSIARVIAKQGQTVACEFNADPIPNDREILITKDLPTIKVELKLRRFFDGTTASLLREILRPGELTQGLCSPWQNDYRECACYYWAASRPDYVNVEPGPDGLSHGDMWMSKKRTGEYIPDDRKDKRLYSYDDLFIDWQGYLKFIIRGKDAERS